MNDADSLSLTPPLSPGGFLLEDVHIEPSPPVIPQLQEDKSPCFICLGEVISKGDNFHANSYWKSAFLQRLLSGTLSFNVHIANSTKSLSLCNRNWPSGKLQESNIDEQLFLLLRQQIGELHLVIVRSRSSCINDEGLDGLLVRTNVNDFLYYLIQQSQSVNMVQEQVEKMLTRLHTLLLHMGRLPDLLYHVMPAIACGLENKASASHHCFHLHLDVYWKTLCILHILQQRYPEYKYANRICITSDGDHNAPLYDQLLHVILWDLVYLANHRYVTKVVNSEYIKQSMFSCTCVLELWLLLLKLSEWRKSSSIGESFWISIHHVIKMILELDSTESVLEMEDCRMILNPPEGFKMDDPLSLCLWLMYNISPLFSETFLGNLQQKDGKFVSNYHDLLTLLKKKLFATKEVTEAVLRKHLHTVLLLTNSWEPNIDLLITLWDHFYRTLNNQFQTISGTLDGLACIDTSIVGLYDRCKQWTYACSGNLDNESSFQLFLRILCQHLGRLYSSGYTQEWRMMKGRIYSKFHARRIQELMESGLYNLTALFISLGMLVDLEDVASKLCDLYDMLNINTITFTKRSVIWRGAFTMMLVYIDRHMDISFLADRMVSTFEHSVKDFKDACFDTRHSLWKLMLIYLEGLQEVVDNSPGIKMLLCSCSEHELGTCLSTLQVVISRFRQIKSMECNGNSSHFPCTVQREDFAYSLWRTIYPSIVDFAQTPTAPTLVADIAASFCLLALTSPPEDPNTTFKTIVKYFSASDNVNISISCRFLGHVLSCNDVMSQLKSCMENHENFIISAWFRCSLQLASSLPILAEVSRHVLQLKEVRDIMTKSGMHYVSNLDDSTVMFLKAIEKAHKRIESWQEKMFFQQKITVYFIDVPKHVSAVLKTLSPLDVVVNTYRMTGYLVKYCAKLIYVRQDVIIPSLINSMILPHHVMSSNTVISPVFLSAVKETLHLFMNGLSKLAFDRDPFVQRRLNDIITVYLPKFALHPSVMSSVSMIHPIVASLGGSFIQNPSVETIKFRHYILQLVINNYLQIKVMTVNPNHVIGVSFLYEVTKRSNSTEIKARDLPLILSVCLEYLLLLSDQTSIWQMILSLVQETWEAYSLQKDCVLRLALSQTCDKFISNYFKFSSTGVVKLMEKLAVPLPDLVIMCIEKLSQNIVEIEKKAIGVDKKLRAQYYHVLRLLGEQGEVEIHRLTTNVY